MTDNESEFKSYYATYCESCGTLSKASDEITTNVSEPIHRVDILDHFGGVENPMVHETVGIEQTDCDSCGGTVVKRYYAIGEVPEIRDEYKEYAEENAVGRDPMEDALLDLSGTGEDYQEVREIPWLEDGSDI